MASCELTCATVEDFKRIMRDNVEDKPGAPSPGDSHSGNGPVLSDAALVDRVDVQQAEDDATPDANNDQANVPSVMSDLPSAKEEPQWGSDIAADATTMVKTTLSLEHENTLFDRMKESKDVERAIEEKMDRDARERWEEAKRKQEEEGAATHAAEKGLQDELRKKLKALGYTDQTIEIMVDEEKTKNFQTQVSRPRSLDRQTTTTKRTPGEWDAPTRSPVYPKVHKDYIELKTLEYYQLPWHYDRVRSEYL